MKKTPFVGRLNELKQLKNLTRKKTSSLLVVSGRRRIGKSRLIEEFSKEFRFLRFSGIPPTPKTKPQDQRNEFARQLSMAVGYPAIQVNDWGDLFSLLARETRNGKAIILFDEISWMGSKDPLFLGKLKNAWDMEFKSNPELILILCGSVSSWIEKNILNNTGFMGRLSLNLQIQELQLPECNQLLNVIGFRGSEYDKFKILSITGGVPRYLEEIQPHLTVEANIQQLCFQPSGILFREFNDIFSDLFSQRSSTYKKIVATLIDGTKESEEIAKKIGLSRGSYLSDCLNDLIQLGFIRRDYTWLMKTRKDSKLSHFRLIDNYLRFYLKYIEPNYSKIANKPMTFNNLKNATVSESIMGLQFENLVIANRHLIWKYLSINSDDIINDNPYFQRKTKRVKGCQIDYLIQNHYNNLFVCEIKFSRNTIGTQIIEEVNEKIKRLSLPKGFSTWPVLIHVNGVTDAVIESDYFCQIINFSTLLQDGKSLLASIKKLYSIPMNRSKTTLL